MITVTSFADLQAAIDAYEPSIEVSGVLIGTGQVLNIHQADGLSNQQGMSVIRGGVLRCAGIVVDGFRRMKIKELELYASGDGITVRNGIQLYLEDVYDTCHGDSLVLESVAGVWARGLQHSASVAGQLTVGQRIGNSAMGYESVDAEGVLIEGHYTGVRIGGTGNCENIWLDRYKLDRQGSAGFLINPAVTAGCRNINIINPWINGAPYPIAINGTETTGRVDRINLRGGEFLGCGHVPMTVWSGVNNVTTTTSGQQVIGPLEPG